MMVAGAVKPCCCPLLSPKISAAMPVVTSSAPRTSTRTAAPDRFPAGSRWTSASVGNGQPVPVAEGLDLKSR